MRLGRGVPSSRPDGARRLPVDRAGASAAPGTVAEPRVERSPTVGSVRSPDSAPTGWPDPVPSGCRCDKRALSEACGNNQRHVGDRAAAGRLAAVPVRGYGLGSEPVRPGPGASRLAMPVPGGGAPCCVLGCPLRGTSLFDESWDGWRTGGPPSSWRPDAASPRTWHRCPSLWSLDGSACRSSTWPAHRWPRPAPATSGLPWLGLMPRPLISGCREMARWRIACACPPAWRLGLVALHFRFT